METTQVQSVRGGIATVFVSDVTRAVKFYTESLGFKLTYQAGEHWASIDAGDGFQIGLHPAGKGPQPGVQGGIQIGFNVTRPIEEVLAELQTRGIEFPKGVIDDDGAVKLAFFKDPDGNEHYLCESKH